MGNRTKLEKQIQAYGQFQSTIRGMSQDEKMQYASEGPQAELRKSLEMDLDERRAKYNRELAEFDQTRPLFGKPIGLSLDEARENSEILQKWVIKRKAFVQGLRNRYSL